MVLRPQLVHRSIWNLLDIAGTILQLQSTMEFHRQLIHQQHLQSHLHCGNDPTVANHNGNLSATHPPAPLAIPFTLRERSYSCKSQWNSVDRTCTKNSWNPIYNAEPIRPWSDHDPTTHETVSQPSHRRGRSSRFGDGLCIWKNIGFRASAISQKRISCETSFKTPSATPPPAPLAIPFALRERSYTVANHNGIPSATHPPAPLAIPFKLRGTILQLQITMEFCRPHMHEKQLKPHLQCGTDPTMIRPHTRPSRNRRTAEVDHRGSGTDFVWKNIGFRASAISLKTHFVRDFLQNSIGNSSTSTTCNAICIAGAILQLQITMEFHRQLIHQHHLQSHLHCGNDPIQLQITMEFCRPHMHEKQLKPHLQCGTDPTMIRPWSDHTRDRLATVAPQR